MAYQIPTAAETPRVELLVTERSPAPGNPLGVRVPAKGVTAAGAAIASAVRDALGLAGSIGEPPMDVSVHPAGQTLCSSQPSMASSSLSLTVMPTPSRCLPRNEPDSTGEAAWARDDRLR
jgi:hypothetical protein